MNATTSSTTVQNPVLFFPTIKREEMLKKGFSKETNQSLSQ